VGVRKNKPTGKRPRPQPHRGTRPRGSTNARMNRPESNGTPTRHQRGTPHRSGAPWAAAQRAGRRARAYVWQRPFFRNGFWGHGFARLLPAVPRCPGPTRAASVFGMESLHLCWLALTACLVLSGTSYLQTACVVDVGRHFCGHLNYNGQI